MSIGIYKITSPSGKIYIGQSINIIKRFKNYKCLSCKDQPIIYNSFKKHGVENHIFEIIEECTIEQLDEREIYWKQHYIEKYNKQKMLFCEIYDKSGGPRSDFTKQKIGLANSKPKPQGFGDKISKASSGISRNKGHIVTQEIKQRMSENMKGKKSNFKQNILLENIEIIKSDYVLLSLNELAKKHDVSHFTMRNFLKENNIFEFRKNYRK